MHDCLEHGRERRRRRLAEHRRLGVYDEQHRLFQRRFHGSLELAGAGLRVVTNLYAEPGWYSVSLSVSNASGIEASRVRGGYVQIYSDAGVAHVATNGLAQWPYHTWTKAATRIQLANGVAPDMLILVSNGTYQIVAELTPNDGAVLRSVNGAGRTVVRRSDSGGRVFNIGTYAGTPVSHAVVDGFTIRDGHCVSGQSGGGVSMSVGTVQNCIVVGNSAAAYGGGISITGGMVSNCVLTGNAVGYDGGGFRMGAPGGLVVDCVITNNTAGRWGGGLQFDNMSGTPGVVRNCLVAQNWSGEQGGGISTFNADCSIESCTVAANTADSGLSMYPPPGGGGIWRGFARTPGITNTIVYFNQAPTNANLGGTFSVGYSCSPGPHGRQGLTGRAAWTAPRAGNRGGTKMDAAQRHGGVYPKRAAATCRWL